MSEKTHAFPLSADDLRAAVRGVVEVSNADAGSISLHRLPAWARAQADPYSILTAGQASGVRLEVVTAATWIEIDLKFTRSHAVFLPQPLAPACIGVEADGHEQVIEFDEGAVRRFGVNWSLDFVDGPTTTARIDLPHVDAPRKVVIWLPPNAEIQLFGVRADAVIEAAARTQRTWIHYGSSISHGSDVGPLAPWPVIASRALDLDLANLGLSGSAHLDGFAARTLRAADADLITLKVGINVVNGDTLHQRTFAPAVHAFLDTLREAQPTTPIVLISPIFCPIHEDAPGPTEWSSEGQALPSARPADPTDGRLTLVAIRRTLQDIVAQRSADDANLHHLDGLALFGPEDAHHLPDNLHPDADGYQLISERFVTHVRSLPALID